MKKLVRVTFFTALLTLVRMASGFLIAKVVAIYTGPTGMAMLGQAQSLITSLNGVVTAPVGNGVVRFTAGNVENGFIACAPWWRAALQISVILLLIVVPLGFIFSTQISDWLFSNTQYYWVVMIACAFLPFSVINTFFTSIINGQQQYKRYIQVGMISVVSSTVLMVFLIAKFQLQGALVAAAVNSSIAGCVMLMICCRQPWFRFRYWLGFTGKKEHKDIGKYVLMAMTSALATPVALVIIRNILIEHVGWDFTGQWQAVWKISEVYLAVITMALSTYYLPRLSTISGIDNIKKEINQTAYIIMPIVSALAFIVYLCRDLSITLLFTEAFRDARDLFAVQLIGDVVKIFSWLYAFPMLAKGAVKWFVGTEVLFSMTLVLFSWFFILKYGVSGAPMAYLANYSVYSLFIYFNLKRFAM